MVDSVCLNCANWQRLRDPVIGVCKKRELASERFRFQYESCGNYEGGEERRPYNEPGYAVRVRNYTNVYCDPKKEAQAVEMMRAGMKVNDIKTALHVGSQVIASLTKIHRDAYEEGLAKRVDPRRARLDQHAQEIRRLLEQGQSYNMIGSRLGINRQTVSAYVRKQGWR